MKVACCAVVWKYDGVSRKVLALESSKGRGLTIPGGKWEEGVDRTYRECAARETLEETGIIVNPTDGKLVFNGLSSNHKKYMYIFEFESYQGELRNSGEGKPLWVPQSELLLQGEDHLYRRVYDLIFELED